jgi:RND family efflux transporter MFP subunit
MIAAEPIRTRPHAGACGIVVLVGNLVSLVGLVAAASAQVPQAPEALGMMGILTPQREMALEPSIEGQLVDVLVRIGDEVGAGDVIAVLDDEVWRRDVEAAQARLEAAEAEQQLAATRLAIAEESLERQRLLLDQQAASRESVRTAERDVELATSQDRQSLALVRQQQAALDQIQVRLRQTRIRAPFAGRVAERYLNPGTTIGPGTAIVRLISSQELLARFAAPVESADALTAGRRVVVAVTDLGRSLPGTISQVGAEIDAASGMIIAEAEIALPDDWDGPPLSGQTVRVRLAD